MNWNELEPHFCAAADHLEDVFNQTIKICDLFEQLNREVAEAYSQDDQLFSRTQECLETLNLLASISNPDDVPPEMVLRATQIFMRAQYMLSIITRIVSVMESKPDLPKAPVIPLHKKGFYH